MFILFSDCRKATRAILPMTSHQHGRVNRKRVCARSFPQGWMFRYRVVKSGSTVGGLMASADRSSLQIGKPILPPGLENRDCHGVGQVQAALSGQHRQFKSLLLCK